MKRFFRRHSLLVLILFLVLIAGIGGYFYENNISYKNPTQAAQTEAESLAKEVGKLIILPTDEVPTIATVSDPTALSNQAFFAGAKKGDKVLIYTSAKKAVLYDPAVKKIVNVAPVNVGGAPTPSDNLVPNTTGGVSTSNNNEF